MRTETVNSNQEQCNQNLTPQLIDAPDILKCLYELFHGIAEILMMSLKLKRRIP